MKGKKNEGGGRKGGRGEGRRDGRRKELTFDMLISLMTYCFPSCFFRTRRARPYEPSPIFFTRTYLSI